MAVWICQCLCPGRHCMMATVGEAESETEAEIAVRTPLRRKIVEALSAGILNPWCAMCGANRATWKYEVSRTRFATMEDAIPHMFEAEAANMATNLLWGDTHKPERPN